MEGFNVLLYVVILIWGVLNIILFFKLWGMTNNVKNILMLLNCKDNREVKLPSKAVVKGVKGEVQVEGMVNGKVLCRRNYNSVWYEDLYDFSRLEFIDDEKDKE